MTNKEELPILREEGAFRGIKNPEVPPQATSEEPAEEPTPTPKANGSPSTKEPTLLEEIASYFRGKKHE